MNKRIKELDKQADKLTTEENKYYNFAKNITVLEVGNEFIR